MIISDTEKFIFIHNPKAGGMTFRSALAHFDTRDNFFFEWKDIGPDGKKLDMAHITPYQLRRYFPQVFEDIKGYYKFGFVRNPYSRFLSAISQHLKLSTPYIRRAMLSDHDLFYRFSNSFAVHSLKEDAVEQDHRMIHFRRQSNFFYLDGNFLMDDLFKLENPERIEGTPAATWLAGSYTKPKNQTEQMANVGYDISRLSQEALQVLNDFYKVDFERFDYSFQK